MAAVDYHLNSSLRNSCQRSTHMPLHDARRKEREKVWAWSGGEAKRARRRGGQEDDGRARDEWVS